MLAIHVLAPIGHLTIGLQRLLASTQGVTWHQDTASWVAMSPEMTATVAVVDLIALGATRACDAIRDLRRRWMLAPVVGYADFTPASAHAIVQAAKAGMGAVVLDGINSHPSALQNAFDQAIAGTLSHAIEPELDQIQDSTVTAYVRGCFLNPLEPANVEDVSRCVYVTPRSVARAFRRSILPSPEYFISTARLLLAMRLLEDRDRSVRSVAEAMQYSDPAVLRRVLRARIGDGYVRSRDAKELHGQLEAMRRLLRASAGA